VERVPPSDTHGKTRSAFAPRRRCHPHRAGTIKHLADDALHVAIAILTRQDVLVSWNFKHLVNQRRRAAIDALNISIGLPRIAILSPPEL